MNKPQILNKKIGYAFFVLVGFFFVFFCKTERDLAVNGNILWTGGYVASLLLQSILLGAVTGGALCFLFCKIAMRTVSEQRGHRYGKFANLALYKRLSGIRLFFEENRVNTPCRFGIYFALIALSFLPVYLAFYPGICAYDITLQMGQLENGLLNEHHPLVHTLLIKWALTIGTRVFDSVNAGIALYTALQMLFLAAGFAYALVMLRRFRVKWYWQLLLLLYCMVYPFHHYLSVSITKDIVFAPFFLIFVLTMAAMLKDNRNSLKIGGDDIVLFLCGIGSVLFRTNGKYALLVLVVFLLAAVIWGKHSRKLFGRLFLVSMAVVVVGQIFLSAVFAVTEAGQGDRREMLSMPIQQMARCMIYHGGVGVEPTDDNTMSDADKALVNDFLLNESYKKYKPYLSDPVKIHTNTYVPRYRSLEFIETYLRLLTTYPGDFINAGLAVNAGYFYPGDITHTLVYEREGVVGEGYVQVLWAEETLNNWGVYKDSKWQWLHDVMEEWADQNAYLNWPVLKYLFVPGTYLWLYCLAAGYLLIKRRFRMLLPLSLVLGYYITLFLGPTVQLRYLYPLMISLPFLVLAGNMWEPEEIHPAENVREKNPGAESDLPADIYLRLMTEEDTDLIVAWRNSEAVRKNFIYQSLFTREGHLRWIENMVKPGKVVQMIICDRATDKPLGSVYIRDIDREHNKAEYGIFIGEPEARGRGVGTAAAKLMLKYCFEQEGLHRIYLRAFAENLQAIGSYEKAGFVREAVLKDDVRIDGQYRDIVWMAAINPAEKP